MTIETALIAAVTALASAVGYLYRLQHLHFEQCREDHRLCEEKRERQWHKIVEYLGPDFTAGEEGDAE